MPAVTAYGVQLLVELGIGRAGSAGVWGTSGWSQAVWHDPDTSTGDWVDVTCDLLDDVRLTAGSNTDDGVTRRWESASASFTLDGERWDPWNGPHRDVLGDRTPVRISWRAAPTARAGAPAGVRTNRHVNPQAVSSNPADGRPAGFVGHPGLSAHARSSGAPLGMRAACRFTNQAAGNTRATVLAVMAASATFSVRFTVRASFTGTLTCSARPVSTSNTGQVPLADVEVAAGVPVEVVRTFTTNTVAGWNTATAGIALVRVNALGDWLEVSGVLLEQAATAGPFFDGSTPDEDWTTYDWTGVPDASTSTATTVAEPAWQPAFTGYVATRGYEWDPEVQEAAVACVDGTSVLVASGRVASSAQGAGESAAARVRRVADAALWPAGYDVTAGGTPVQATTLEAPAWDELLEVADTDLALMWVNRAGVLAYRPRGRVGAGVQLAGRLVVCPAAPGDVAVMTMGRNQPTATRNRVTVARRKDDTVPGDVPAVATVEDRESVARYQAHDFKRTDLWHVDDAWSGTLAAAILGAGAWPSPAPGAVLLDSITEDPAVPALLLSIEPDRAFDVVDDDGTTYRQAVVGWDVQVTHGEIEGVLYLEDVTRWTAVGHWGTAHWNADRWGIGGI
jgi:hypothetical protein